MALFTIKRVYLLSCSKLFTKRWMSTMSRAVATFDQEVEAAIKDGKVNTRRHPGVFNRGVVRLPDDLKQAVEQVISDVHTHNLLKDAQELNNHIIFKKPPLSPNCLENLKLQCKEKVMASNPVAGLNYMTDEDYKKTMNSLNSKTNNIFKQKAYQWRAVEYNESTALTYLAARLAPDFASLLWIFNEISKRDPHFELQTLFDFGSGIGTTLWAAKSCWDATMLKEAFCVDSSISMNSLALALIQGGVFPKQISDSVELEEGEENQPPALKGLYFRQFLPSSGAIKYNLVVCAHTLLELPSAELRLQTALSLWRKTQGYLVFVEHGSRAAYEVIVEVRDFLLSLAKNENEPNLTGHVFSPCAHELFCPRLTDTTPCNFQVTYEPLFHSQKSGFPKEKFSYVVLKKGTRSETDPTWPRVVRPVLSRNRHTICRLCTQKGQLEEVVITRGKHGRDVYHCAKNTEWGDLLPVHLTPQSELEQDVGEVSDEPLTDVLIKDTDVK